MQNTYTERKMNTTMTLLNIQKSNTWTENLITNLGEF